MATAYIFTLQPTFTQGLVMGHASLLLLLFLVLRYLSSDRNHDRPYPRSYRQASYQPKRHVRVELGKLGTCLREGDTESSEWLNFLLQQVLNAYRAKLRDGLSGPEGDEAARQRVEDFANKLRPAGFLGCIKVHSVDMGASAPRLSRARICRQFTTGADPEIEYDMNYIDSVSISISTSVLLDYTFPFYCRLPVSLTISLSLFAASVRLMPPDPHASHPTVTFTLPAPHTDFTLDIKTTSLFGSAKLEDIRMLHDLIEYQIRRVILEKGTWKVALPGLASVSAVKNDART